MSSAITLELPLAKEFKGFKMPRALDQRLTELLDRQDLTGKLTPRERKEAEALVELAEMLTLLRWSSDSGIVRKKSV